MYLQRLWLKCLNICHSVSYFCGLPQKGALLNVNPSIDFRHSSIDFQQDTRSYALTGKARVYSRRASKLKYFYCKNGCRYNYDYIYNEILYTTDTR